MKIRVGSRGSSLALAQAQSIVNELKKRNPSFQLEIKVIKTKGDHLLDKPVWQLGEKGLFVKELEMALEQREIDLAVHSVKDLPAIIPETLCLAAFPPRENPCDALVTRSNLSWEMLPEGSVLGTSALRRQAQLLYHRPDLQIKMLRGNVDTRLKKLEQGEYFGIVVAQAGLSRLGIDQGVAIPVDILLPCPGQGALAIQMRTNDKTLLEIVNDINDPPTAVCVSAERSFLLEMEGGCQLPLGALANIEGETLTLKGFLGNPDGKHVVRDEIQGKIKEAQRLGRELAKRIRNQGEFILKALETLQGLNNSVLKASKKS